MLFKAGNSKIDKACLISCLPTHICFGEGHQCKGCYAKKPEGFRPNCLPSRERHLIATKQDDFVDLAITEISKSKKTMFRIHESGDFYSQEYIDKWVKIAKALPAVGFYCYTKKWKTLDFSALSALENVNVINSFVDGKLNYGSREYVDKLVSEGYLLCPCGIDKSVKCMRDCKQCMTNSRVCFVQH